MTSYQLTSDNAHQLIREIRVLTRNAHFLAAVTGAGISRASGLPLFGESIGGVPIRQFFSTELLNSCPEKYFGVYRQALLSWRSARPNDAHLALARAGAWVITQNIDGLHRDAGSIHLIELHGNFRELICTRCELILDASIVFQSVVPRCTNCGRILRPGVSLVGDEIRHFSRAVDWVGRAEVVLIIGTNLEMNPVCDLPKIAESAGASLVWVNEEAEHLVPALLSQMSPDK